MSKIMMYLDHHHGTEALLNSMADGGKNVRVFAHSTFEKKLLEDCKLINCSSNTVIALLYCCVIS